MGVLDATGEEDSKTEFLITVIGGIIGLLVGLVFFVLVVYSLWQVGFTGGNPAERGKFLTRVIIALYFSVVNVWIITAGFWMGEREKAGRGAWTATILGIMTLNVIAIVGGIMALMKRKPKSRQEVFGVNRQTQFVQPREGEIQLENEPGIVVQQGSDQGKLF